MQVLWWQAMARNESECRLGRLRWEGALAALAPSTTLKVYREM